MKIYMVRADNGNRFGEYFEFDLRAFQTKEAALTFMNHIEEEYKKSDIRFVELLDKIGEGEALTAEEEDEYNDLERWVDFSYGESKTWINEFIVHN